MLKRIRVKPRLLTDEHEKRPDRGEFRSKVVNDNYTSLFLGVDYYHGEGLILLPFSPHGGLSII